MDKFSTLLALCARNLPVTGEFPSQRPVTWSFDVFFYLRINERFSKQPSHRAHYDVIVMEFCVWRLFWTLSGLSCIQYAGGTFSGGAKGHGG